MESIMKKAMCLSMGLAFLFTTVLFILPCQAQETINGCYKIKNGQLRVVPGPEYCKKSELPMTFNGTLTPPPDPLTDGPVCLEVDGYPNLKVKIVFKKMGEGNYTFSGAAWDGLTPYTMMTGNALVVGNKLYMASHEAGGSSTNFWTSQNLIIFEKDTMNKISGLENILSWDSTQSRVDPDHNETGADARRVTCP
jgi:hypothetical protein